MNNEGQVNYVIKYQASKFYRPDESSRYVFNHLWTYRRGPVQSLQPAYTASPYQADRGGIFCFFNGLGPGKQYKATSTNRIQQDLPFLFLWHPVFAVLKRPVFIHKG